MSSFLFSYIVYRKIHVTKRNFHFFITFFSVASRKEGGKMRKENNIS